MDARDRQLGRYIASYSTLFPSTPVLIVRSNGAHYLASETHRVAGLEKASEYLASTGRWDDQRAVLLHVISMGGVDNLVCLARSSSRGWSPRAIVFDSAPAIGPSLKGSLHAFTFAISSPLVKSLVYPPLALVLLLGRLRRFLPLLALRRPTPDRISHTAALLNDPSVLSRSTKRTYIYSPDDALIPSSHVETHARRARADGVDDVRLERFDGGGHVGHERSDPSRYWRTVETTWRSGAAKTQRDEASEDRVLAMLASRYKL